MKYFLIFICLFIVISCDKTSEIMKISDVVTNNSYKLPDIAVNGTFTSELKFQEIQITKPQTYNNANPLFFDDSLFYDYYGLSGAKVIVQIHNVEYEFIESIYHSNYPNYKKKKGLYISKNKIQGIINTEHMLQIEYKNKTYYAKDIMKPVKAFDSYSEVLLNAIIDSTSMKYNNTNFGVTDSFFAEFSYTDSSNTGTSLFKLYDISIWNYFFSINLPPALMEESKKSSSQAMFSDRPDRIYSVRKYSVSDLYQKYILSVFTETIWNKSSFRSLPSNVTTNLSNGAVGFFATCDVYSKQTTFKTLLEFSRAKN